MARLLAGRSPAERLRMASSMFDTARELMIAGLRRRDSGLNDAQLRARVFLNLYGDCFSPDEINAIATHVPNMQLCGDR